MVMYRLQQNIRPGGRYERYSSMVMHEVYGGEFTDYYICLLYTSDAADE